MTFCDISGLQKQIFSLFVLCSWFVRGSIARKRKKRICSASSCNEKWEAIKKKRSEAGKKGMESRWGKPKQTITNDNNVIGVITSDNKSKQTITKITVTDTVTDTVTGTVTVPVTNKPPDGTAPDGAAPPAKPAQN